MKKKILGICLGCFIVIILLFWGFKFLVNKPIDNNDKNDEIVQEKDNLPDIKKNYNTTVVINNDTSLYKKDNNKFIEIGVIYKDSVIDLEKIEALTKEDEYFKVSNSSYYIHYKDVSPNKKQEYDQEYKDYIPFNKSIKTKTNINIYFNNKSIAKLNESVELEIIINDSDVYYVEFLGRLCSIRKVDVLTTIANENNNSNVAKEIAVLNYHFFYDSSIGESCNQSICLKKSYFEEHLKYIKDNDYYTITTRDLDLWMDKKINLPEKSVLITVDDGAMGTDTHLIELLEKYDLNGTLFLITAWWPKEKYASSNLEIQSHGHDIHLENYCKNVARGAKGLCLSKEQLINDFKKSIDKLDGEKTSICYPFYLYNKNMLDAMKEIGFKLGFAGGERKVTQSDDKYKIPRFVIYNYMTANNIKEILN